MSIIDWFNSKLHGIGSTFRKLWAKAKPFIQKEIPVAVGVINLLKMAVDTGLPTYLAKMTGNQLDDMLVEQAKSVLPGIIIKLKILQLDIDNPSNEEIIHGLIKFLASLDPKARFGYYKMLCDYLTDALVDGLQWSEIVILNQMIHDGKVDGVQKAA